MPNSDALPPPASPPVCGMLMPILIGGCWALTPEITPSVATAMVPPRSVLRFIFPPVFSFNSYWMNQAAFTTEKPLRSSDVRSFLSNPAERCQYDLRREGDFRDGCAERPQRIIDRIRPRRRRAGPAGLARARGAQVGFPGRRNHVADVDIRHF